MTEILVNKVTKITNRTFYANRDSCIIEIVDKLKRLKKECAKKYL